MLSHGKKSFAEISKNLAKSLKIIIYNKILLDHQNNYGCSKWLLEYFAALFIMFERST